MKTSQKSAWDDFSIPSIKTLDIKDAASHQPHKPYDVVIIGGGLAGILTAHDFRRTRPQK